MSDWGILGAGALGCVFAGLLRQQGHQVSLLLSERHRGHLHPGMDMITLGGHHELIHTRPLFAEQAGRLSRLLVTTKAYQVVDALRGLRGLPTDCPVILLHNGMGVTDAVRELLPHNPILVGVTSHGAMKESQWQIRHTGKGETWIGPANQAARNYQHLCQPLATAFGHAQWSENIDALQRQKLAINAVINPLTARYDVHNGDLLEPRYLDVLEQLIEEVHQVMRCLGDTETLEQFRRRLHRVMELTATNYSSMHQDLAHGRPTEIDYITGYILGQARQHQLPAPVCRQLYQEIIKRSPGKG
ncbi:ketopantoate reductase family protein [Zobellella maritima]|uniref:ketopantoate reductase family protein n=1 Tax=Zobellella maritima TaxID=2059725 RepID=UPI000E3033B0|nr:2-dehydropantoate 2-reductase [Zobellella maritima]